MWHDPVIGADKCGLSDGAPAAVPDPDDPAAHEQRAIARLTVEQLGWLECDRNPEQGAYPDQSAEASELAGYDYRVVTLAELFEFVRAYAAFDLKTAAQRETAERVGFNMNELISWEVDGIITDRPDLLLETIDRP